MTKIKNSYDLKFKIIKEDEVRYEHLKINILEDSLLKKNEISFNDYELSSPTQIIDPKNYSSIEINGLPLGFKFNNKTGEIYKSTPSRFHKGFKAFLNNDFKHVIAAIFISPIIFLLYLYIFYYSDILGKSKIDISSLIMIFSPFFVVGFLSIFANKLRTKTMDHYSTFLIFAIILNFILFLIYDENISQTNNWDYLLLITLSLSIGTIFSQTLGYISKSIKDWIFTKDDNQDEHLKKIEYKLSFINKIIIGFISIVASVISLYLTFK